MERENKIVHKKLDEIFGYINNSRIHSTAQIEQIKNSIKRFGYTNPILIDVDGQIIAGHGRYEAAKHLKMQSIPCIVLENLTDEEKRAYVIADNKIGLNAEYDDELLKLELESLKELEEDLINFTGFSDSEVVGILSENYDLDDIEPPQGLEKIDDGFKKINVTVHADNVEKAKKVIEQSLEAASIPCEV